MRSIETHHSFPLASVKPLEQLLGYRERCLAATRRALKGGAHRRERSPVTGAPLQPYGTVEGLAYARCPDTGSLFLAELPDSKAWADLLAEVNRYRHSPEAFHQNLARSRADHVYAPKLEWIQETLRLQEVVRPKILEVATPPSGFTALLERCGTFAEVLTVDEMQVAAADVPERVRQPEVHAAVLLESLDRVDDPVALLQGVSRRLSEGGLLFVTALVSSGFDMTVLGSRNAYLYPPDRANCFSVKGLDRLLTRAGFTLIEVSTPGVLDVEIVRAHVQHDPSVPLSAFERELLEADRATHEGFQAFLQQRGLSSFARMVGRKR